MNAHIKDQLFIYAFYSNGRRKDVHKVCTVQYCSTVVTVRYYSTVLEQTLKKSIAEQRVLRVVTVSALENPFIILGGGPYLRPQKCLDCFWSLVQNQVLAIFQAYS
jgi:hypothetical protein